MFYVFCDIAIVCAITGIIASIVSDIGKMGKKHSGKVSARLSNILGAGFVICALITTVCFFAGWTY